MLHKALITGFGTLRASLFVIQIVVYDTFEMMQKQVIHLLIIRAGNLQSIPLFLLGKLPKLFGLSGREEKRSEGGNTRFVDITLGKADGI